MSERNEEAARLQAQLDGYRDGVAGLGQKPPTGFYDETDFGCYRQAHIEGAGTREQVFAKGYERGKAHARLEDREKLAKAAADACLVSDSQTGAVADDKRFSDHDTRITRLEKHVNEVIADTLAKHAGRSGRLEVRMDAAENEAKRLDESVESLFATTGVLARQVTKIRKRVTKYLKGEQG